MGSLSISLSGWGDIYSRGVLAGLLVGILSWFWELWLISHSKEGRGQRFRQGVDAQSAWLGIHTSVFVITAVSIGHGKCKIKTRILSCTYMQLVCTLPQLSVAALTLHPLSHDY